LNPEFNLTVMSTDTDIPVHHFVNRQHKVDKI